MSPPLEDMIRRFASERRYAGVTIERWLGLDAPDGAALLTLAEELRLGENQLRELWEWAEDIGDRDGRQLAEVLALEPIVAARRQRVGRNDKLKLVKRALRRLRFPSLSASEDQLANLIRSLALPPNVRVHTPAFLEGDEVRIEITARTANGLRRALASLTDAASSRACDEIFGVLENWT